MNIFRKTMNFIFCHSFYRVEYVGEDKVDYSKPNIFAANHITWVDGIMLWAKTDNMAVMAKKELFRIKWLGEFFKRQGAFPISRNKKDFGSMYHAMNIVKATPPMTLLIFPEGTRKAALKGIKAKTGVVYIAARTGVPITPIYIQEKRRPFHKTQIIYGEPIKIDIPRENIKDKEMLRKQADILMEKIYSMRSMLDDEKTYRTNKKRGIKK